MRCLNLDDRELYSHFEELKENDQKIIDLLEQILKLETNPEEEDEPTTKYKRTIE